MRSVLSLVILCTGITGAAAQNVNLVEGSLSENAYKAAESSGSSVVGAQFLAIPEIPPGEGGVIQFAVVTAEGFKDHHLCVTATAANGLYDGRGSYLVSGTDPEVSDAEFTSEYSEVLDELGTDDLAIAAHLRDCGERASLEEGTSEENAIELALAYWRTRERLGTDGTIRFLINPFDATKLRMVVKKGGVEEGAKAECGPVSTPVAATFSIACDFDASQLVSSPAVFQLQARAPGREPTETWIKLHFRGS